ncbi:MAG: hypothetical protein FWE67_09415 [Planctomycetaceae bacterium]|nr:hypothetical protein [Planctomycetaceae bacterium]
MSEEKIFDSVVNPDSPNSAALSYRKFFFEVCEKAFYYEFDRQSRIQNHAVTIILLASGLCAVTWYFSSYEYLRSVCVLYSSLLILTWAALIFTIGLIAHAVMYRSNKVPADMRAWNKWLAELEKTYGSDSIKIEDEAIKQITSQYSKAQTIYAESNEVRYRSLRQAQVILVAVLVLILMLAASKTALDYDRSSKEIRPVFCRQGEK